MRVTINLDDDVLEYLDKFSQERPMSRGRAASELIRRGISRPAPTHIVNGLRVFSASKGAARITAEHLHGLDSEQDLDKVR
ncbi:MAG: CopG family transcriptional regulator [Silvibacterium sp.]